MPRRPSPPPARRYGACPGGLVLAVLWAAGAAHAADPAEHDAARLLRPVGASVGLAVAKRGAEGVAFEARSAVLEVVLDAVARGAGVRLDFFCTDPSADREPRTLSLRAAGVPELLRSLLGPEVAIRSQPQEVGGGEDPPRIWSVRGSDCPSDATVRRTFRSVQGHPILTGPDAPVAQLEGVLETEGPGARLRAARHLGRHAVQKQDAEAPHSVLLVIDATTGQNALNQVDVFLKSAGVTGLIMTKLDGTARGGILVAISARFGVPVHAIGVGEGIDDLQPFDADAFARAIAGIEAEDQ